MPTKPNPKTPSQRKADERERKQKAGLIRKEFWIKPGWETAIKKLIETLSKEQK